MSVQVAARVGGSRVVDGTDPLLFATLSYYWAYLYFRVLLPPPDESAWVYLITVVPVSVAATSGLLINLARGKHGSASRKLDLALLALAFLAVAVSVVRWDLPTIRSIGLLVLTLLWLVRVRPGLSLYVLNGFFWSSVAAGGLWFILDLSEYGLLPGQYAQGADRGIEWRVSLFPYVPESGFFALIVFLANQLHRRGRARTLYCLVSLYFIIFSGMRSALVALVLAEAYILFNRSQRSPSTRTAALLLLLAAFVVSIAIASQASMMPALPGGTITNFLFRTESFDDSDLALSHTAYRGWLWAQHFSLFTSSPLTGLGTFEFSAVVDESVIEGMDNTGSESFVTSWFARIGLCFVPFIAYLWLLCRRAALGASAFDGAAFLVLGVAAFAYGSFLVPYNFMFLILFCLLLQRGFATTSRQARRGAALAEREIR